MYLSLSQQKEEKMTTATETTVTVDTAYPITDSSFVEFLAHDSENQTVYVQLGNGTYVYTNVSTDDFVDLLNADSVGHAFHDFARKYGPYTDFYGEGELFYELREAYEEEDADVLKFTLVEGEKSTEDDYEVPDFLSGLLPSDEEVAEARAQRTREIALAAAATSVAGSKYAPTPTEVVDRAIQYEAYLSGE